MPVPVAVASVEGTAYGPDVTDVTDVTDATDGTAFLSEGRTYEVGGVPVRVWRCRLGTAAPTARELRTLSDEETARYRSFHDPVRAAWYARAHTGLRRALAPLLEVAPARVVFGRGPCPTCDDPRHGRPVITAPATELEISLSRSGPYWLCAVTESVPVGADIERLRPSYATGLPEAVLGAAELAHLRSVPPGARAVEFLRCWTRKEAVVKGSGVGITTDLRGVAVRPDLPLAVVRHRAAAGGPDTWAVRDLPAGTDHLAALAVAVPSPRSSALFP
ncbi:4'-phosphopantetheinyl transferase superfamily protein [Streptomyces sp. NPDC000594]|uniref:4'-phosphopantetheinyl transferase family protein n=1 Tax=Streptomyces sp. NPDC000594 TaxID=3154261 RepID=UPI00332B0A65